MTRKVYLKASVEKWIVTYAEKKGLTVSAAINDVILEKMGQRMDKMVAPSPINSYVADPVKPVKGIEAKQPKPKLSFAEERRNEQVMKRLKELEGGK